MRSFIRDLLSVGISKISIILFSLITSIIAARILGPEKNGIISAILVYPSIFLSFGSLGIRQSTTYLLGQGKFKEEEIKHGITQIWLVTSVICVIGSFLLINYLSSDKSDLYLILLAIAPIPFTLFNNYNSGIFLGKNNIRIFNQINWIPPFLIAVSTLLFLAILGLEIEGYFIALLIGPFSLTLILLFKNDFISSFSLNVNSSVIKPLISLGLIYALSLLIINLNYKFDIIMLDIMSSDYQTGIYSKGASITEYLWHIPMLLSTLVFARSATSKDGASFSKKVATLLRISFVLILFGSIVLWLFSYYIVTGMYGAAFEDSVSVLKYLLPGVVLLTVYKVMNMDLAGKGKPWIAIATMTPALIINIILNYLLIPKFGANGSAFSSTISYSFAAITFLFAYSRVTGITIREIITYKKQDFNFLKQLRNK